MAIDFKFLLKYDRTRKTENTDLFQTVDSYGTQIWQIRSQDPLPEFTNIAKNIVSREDKVFRDFYIDRAHLFEPAIAVVADIENPDVTLIKSKKGFVRCNSKLYVEMLKLIELVFGKKTLVYICPSHPMLLIRKYGKAIAVVACLNKG